MNYGDLIRDAIRITRHNRYLWFFGFFVGLGTGGSGGTGGGGGGGDFDEQSSAELASVSTVALQQGPLDNALLIVGVIVLALLIFLVFFALYVVSQGGLTESVAAIERGQERHFSSTWRAGVSYFWRVLGQVLLFVGIALGLLAVVGIPVALLVVGTFAATDAVAARALVAVVAALVVVALLVVVFIPLAIVRQFARRELVVRGEGVLASVGSGYRLFKQNLGRSLLVWLIQLGVMLGAGIALLIALLIVGLILFLPTILLAVASYTAAAIIAGVVAGLVLLPLFVVAVAILGTFNHSYWTLAYLRLAAARV
jgi:hypothetical protein